MIDIVRIVGRARDVTGRAFAERDLVVLERHGFTLVVLADDLLAYVPHDDEHRRHLEIERRVLARIAPRVSFSVPRPVGPIVVDVDLRVPAIGMTGPQHHDRVLGDPDLSRRAAEWMGRALAEIHGSLTRTELDALAVPPASTAHPNDVLLHGDFGMHNLAFDESTGMPTGVFDFHAARRGSAELDFEILRSYGAEVYGVAGDAYRMLAPRPHLRDT